MAKTNKTQEVLKHLQRGWPITSFQAFQMFRATRLGDIIFRLRKKHIIDGVEKVGADGETYTEYRWVRELPATKAE